MKCKNCQNPLQKGKTNPPQKFCDNKCFRAYQKRHVKSPIRELVIALRKDKDYYFGWQSNIAMAIVDETGIDKKTANKCAIRFLKLLLTPSV